MNKRILVIGSTGKLGTILLRYCVKNNLTITALTCFENEKKIINQKKMTKAKKTFLLSRKNQYLQFLEYLKKNNFDLVYFLDYGSSSLKFAEILIKKNKNCFFAIANKEMLIAGGYILVKKIKLSKNILIPLDSEHFSILNTNYKNNSIKKVFITASGGPFYFEKRINLKKVNKKQILNHPKWKMGINNSIDSSNFINKILEIFELSFLFNIDLSNIDFLISREAFVHSLILYNDNTISINCFENDMLIPLSKPINDLYNLKLEKKNPDFHNINKFKFEILSDSRFIIKKYLSFLKKLSHKDQICFMLLNNKAHSLFLSNKLPYYKIIEFIVYNLKKEIKNKITFNDFNDIIKFIFLKNNENKNY